MSSPARPPAERPASDALGEFPIDLRKLKPLGLDPSAPRLTTEQRTMLADNIQRCRDAIVFFTGHSSRVVRRSCR